MSAEAPPTVSRTPVWQRIVPEIVVLVGCAVLLVGTRDMTTSGAGPGPAFYPRLLIGLLALAIVVRIAQQVRSDRRAGALRPRRRAASRPTSIRRPSPTAGWAAVAFTVAYIVATLYLGWPLATFLFVVAFLWAAGKRNLLLTIPIAAGVALAFTYVFVKVVYMALPTGVGVFDSLTVALFELLGIY